MKDYGEPWRRESSEVNTCPIFEIKDRFGFSISDFNRTEKKVRGKFTRAVACVNALSGIPTERLGEVKKAWENYIAQKECK